MIENEAAQNALLQSLLATALDPNHRDRFRAVEEVRRLLAETEAAKDPLEPPPAGDIWGIVGLSREEYLDALQRVLDRQNDEFYDDPDEVPPDILERRTRREKAEAALQAAGLDLTMLEVFVRRGPTATGKVA